MATHGVVLVVSEEGYPIEPLVGPLYAVENLTVHHAATVTEALRRVQELENDLVVVMAHAPASPNQFLYSALRAIPGHQEDPILALVPLGDEQARAAAIEAGADDVLGVPFRPPVLLSRVRTLVRLSQCRRVHPYQNPSTPHLDSTPNDQVKRAQIAANLRQALKKDELLVLYQPKIAAESGVVVGAEAFVRWRMAGAGLVPPGQFMSVAEEEGLILDIGEWITDTVCKQLSTWIRAGLAHVPISINVSQRQFRQQELALLCRSAVDRHRIPSSLLGLELTEAMLTSQPELAIQKLRALRDQGIQLAVDDFGTGYSSLTWLPRFPLTSLKIDQTFVQGIRKQPGADAVVSAIIHIAHALGLRATAEGVETPDQALFLQEQECDELQGYLFSRPVLPDAFARMLADPSAFCAAAQVVSPILRKVGI